MAVSGTVSTTTFNVRKVLDRAFGRCKIKPQLISGEMLAVAQDQLYLLLSDLPNQSFLLWTIKKAILPIYEGVVAVSTPIGTIEVSDVNHRTLTRLSGTYTSSSGTASLAFDDDFTTSCTQVAPAGNVVTQFASATIVDAVGILAASTATVQYTMQVSSDGVTYTTVYATPSYAQAAGQWNWFDMGSHNAYLYFRVVAGASTTINFTELYLGNTPSEIPMYRFNRNDYMMMPNKFSKGRPLQYWFDRQAFDTTNAKASPQLMLWPAPSATYKYSQVVVNYRRHIMDVASMTQDVEVPQRWLDAIISKLAYYIARESTDVPADLMMQLKADADSEVNEAQNEEVDRGPINIRPNLSPYTR